MLVVYDNLFVLMIGIEEGYKGYCKLILFIVGESKNQVMLQYCTRLIPWVHPEEQCGDQSGSIPMQGSANLKKIPTKEKKNCFNFGIKTDRH